MKISDDADRRNRAALFGTSAVAWMLAGSKWGSHIQVGPLFAADLLIGMAILYAVASSLAKVKRAPSSARDLVRGPHWAIALFFAWSVVRLLFTDVALGMTALRDFAPYFYIGLGMLSGVAAFYSTERSRLRTTQILWWAMMFHLVWMAFVTFAPALAEMMPMLPGGRQQVFQIRNDAECSISAVTAAVALHRWLNERGTRYLMIAGLALVLVLLSPTRAGLLGVVAAVALVIAVFFSSGGEQDRQHLRRRMTVAALLPLVAIVSVVALAQTPAGNRMLATFDPSRPTAEGYARATGTTEARERAWDASVNYTLADPDRAIVGVGFGPDFLADSGAAILLLGPVVGRSGETRSPHNYWVGTLARLGLVGLVLSLVVALAACVRIVRIRRYLGHSELHFIAAAIVVAYIPTATFGVMFESPFGAIPYYWSVGLILGVCARSDGKMPSRAHPEWSTSKATAGIAAPSTVATFSEGLRRGYRTRPT